jgi:hypothetical protein
LAAPFLSETNGKPLPETLLPAAALAQRPALTS